MLEVAVVLDNEVGDPARTFGLDLGCDAGPYTALVELIPLDDPRDALLERGDDEDRLIDEPIVAGFKEQRHDVDDDLTRLGIGFAF